MSEFRLRVLQSTELDPTQFYIVVAPGSKNFIQLPAVLEYEVERTGLWRPVPVVTEP
jgi:hypothetical protein